MPSWPPRSPLHHLLLLSLALAFSPPPSPPPLLYPPGVLPDGSPHPSSVVVDVDRRSDLSPDEFDRQYVRKGLPVVVVDVLSRFPPAWVAAARAALVNATAESLGARGRRGEGSTWDRGRKGSLSGWAMPELNLPEKPYFAQYGGLDADDPFYATKRDGAIFWAQSNISFGGQMHIDDSCHSSFSMQYIGNKRWWLWHPDWPLDPAEPHQARRVFRARVNAGEMLVFY